MQIDHRSYYDHLKREARRLAVREMNKKIQSQEGRDIWNGLEIGSITPEALEAQRQEWTRYYGPSTHFGFSVPWERLYHKYRHRPSFFDVAIWQTIEGTRHLQGMALGQPSNPKAALNLYWIERSFAPTYCRGGILIPILACAEAYARLLGCGLIVVKNPVDDRVYTRYGFKRSSDKKRGHAMVKELSHGTEV